MNSLSTKLGADFDGFVRSHGTPLLRAAYVLTDDHGHAEDLVQLTLLRVARHWSAIRSSPEAYAHRTLINLSRNRWRDIGRRPRVEHLDLEIEASALEDSTEVVLSRIGLAEALRRLPQLQREVSVLRFVFDLSVADTAIALGLAEGTVKSSTSRALATLRRFLCDQSEPTNAGGASC
jgi:RNA polymerase sigma-70 factor (sigma-E family)